MSAKVTGNWAIWLRGLCLSAIYFGAAKLGLSFDAEAGFATLVWPPSGIALAALFIYGQRLWPAVYAGAFLINLTTGAPPLVAAGIAAGNTLAAVCAVRFLRRRGFDPALSRLSDAFALVLGAALLSTLVSATIGVLSLWGGGIIQAAGQRPAWTAWWVGDALGDLAVGSLLLVLAAGTSPGASLPERRRGELVALAASVVLVLVVLSSNVLASAISPSMVPYLVFPLVIWAAGRFGARAGMLVNFLVSAAGVYGVSRGAGPFVRGALRDGLIELQFFMSATAVSALALAASMAERVRALHLRRAAEEREATARQIRSIVDSAHDAFIAMDATGVITEWNRQAEALFGWSRATAIGALVGELIVPPRYREAHRRGLAHYLATGEGPALTRRLQLASLTASGAEVPIEMTISAVRTGATVAFGAFVRDVTDALFLAKSQQLQVNVTRLFAEAETVVGTAMGLLEAVGKDLGWDVGVLWMADPATKSLQPFAAWHNGDPELSPFTAACRAVTLAPGAGTPGLVFEDGTPRWLSDLPEAPGCGRAAAAGAAGLKTGIVIPVVSGKDRIGVLDFLRRDPLPRDDRVVDLLVDLSNRFGMFLTRKNAEEELRQNERIRSVVDHVVDGIVTLNEALEIESWNPAAERIFGYTAAEVIGKSAQLLTTETVPPRDEPRVSRSTTGRRKDGSTFPMELGLSEFRHGERRFITTIIRDVTERRRVEAELTAAKTAAEVASRAKSEFLANMSHEIRTPLGAVLGFAELMAHPQLSASERVSHLAAVKRNGELLSTVINDILDLSKVEAGKLDIERQNVAMSDVLVDMTTLCNLRAREKGLTLTVTTARDVPRYLHTDPVRLRQILLNITGNAIKFTSRGGVDVAIRTDGAKLAFVVKDTGPGIGPDQAARLFAPFSQADASIRRSHGGTGLGLALSKRLALLLGGDVTLTGSAVGEGSTFTVTIDPGVVSEAEAVRRTAARRAPGEGAVEVRLDGLRVLLVEDSPDNRFLVGRILKNAGAAVDAAENGQEALDKAHANHYDAMLMDIQMPQMDGFEVTSRLRGEGNATPIIALTAHALAEERRRCLDAGFNDHLSKPINRMKLLCTIAQHAAPIS